MSRPKGEPKDLTTIARREIAKERQRKSHELRVKGWTYPQIADELGVVPSTVCRDIDKYWRDTYEANKEETDLSRNRMLIRLDILAKRMLEKYEAGGATAEAQATLLLRVMEREARLLGLDAPEKTEITGTFQSQISEALARIVTK